MDSLVSPRILPALANLPQTPQSPADILELGKTAAATLDLELIGTLSSQPSPATGAAQYQSAIDAVKYGDHAVVLQRLEQAILAHPIYAETVRLDPAFEPVRGPVQDLVGRLTVLARMRADTSIAAAATVIESADAPEPAQTPELAPSPAPPLNPSLQPAAALPVPQRSVTMTPALPVPPTPSSPAPPAPPDTFPPPRAALAAVEIEMLHRWDDPALREMGAIEYQLAREAAQTGEHAAAIEHLEQAILAQPTYAAAAPHDPAFAAIREPVQQVVNRASAAPHVPPGESSAEPVAGEQADSSQASRTATDAVRLAAMTRSPDAPELIPQAKVYLDVAQAHFELGTYTGYVVAAQAAGLAQQIAEDSKVSSSSKPGPQLQSKREHGLRPLKRAAWRAARRLWEKLPLLAILLGWFVAGALAGLVTLPFQKGFAAMRGILFPVWALGLVAMVLAGFVRSLRRWKR